jgi:hypothetical protein
MWRTRGTGDPVRIVTSFYFTSHCCFYSVTRTRLTVFSLPCLFLVLRYWSDLFVSDRPWFLCSDVASLIGSFNLLGFYSLQPWNRVLAPRIEDTLLKGYFSSVGQVVMGITSVNIRCSDNNCSPSRCLANAHISLSNVPCIWEPLRSKHHIRHNNNVFWGRWQRRLRHYATSWKIASSIPNEVITFFKWPNPSSRTMALGSTLPTTEMSTMNLAGG